MSDSGPQFSSQEFQHFSVEYGFEHVTSSPNFPQANGEAEWAVRIIKTLLNKNDDPLMALLILRSTPLENGYSPAELLMGRKLRTTVPVLPKVLQPKLPDQITLREKENEIRRRQQRNFNCRHKAKVLEPGETVWIADRNTTGTVTKETAV